MGFDLTKEAVLDAKSRRTYRFLQAAIYPAAILGAVYFSYLILFPSRTFEFDFTSPNSSANSIISPRNELGIPITNGKIEKNKNMFFDAALVGNFSKAIVNFTLSNKSDLPESGSVEIRRSYQAFFYPEGEPIEFKDKLSESPDTFNDGTLISYNNGIYVVSGGFVFPIDNPVTFESMGYNWNNVIPASADEFSMYQKGKLFNIKAVHPDGTIFSVAEDGQYYIIKGGLKHPLLSANTALAWMKNDPIMVSKKGLEISSRCEIKKNIFSARQYSCELPIENLASLTGKDYEFRQNFSQNVAIDSLSVTFKKVVSVANFKTTLREMLIRIILRYAPGYQISTQ